MDFDDLPLLKTPKKLPVVLSPDEVTRLIEAAPNLPYRTLLMLLYATGLRRAEAANLKVSDIDSARMLIHVQPRQGIARPGASTHAEDARRAARVLASDKD